MARPAAAGGACRPSPSRIACCCSRTIRACARPRAAAGRALPALLLSGDSSDAARSLARVEGVRMLLKPVDPDELLAELRLLLEGPRP
ncbi:MAG: hypothetical protein FJX69_07070 [Alphaproteobacteria bacterium]|nr:hypothetical protein [Alphaproteobacteria bacterium]